MSSVSPVNKEENDKFIMPALPESSLKIEGYGSIGLVVPEAGNAFLKLNMFGIF